MDTEKIFKTKTGYCHILPEKIVLTRNGVVGDLSKLAMGNNIARPLVIYGILSIGFFSLSVQGFNQGLYIPAFLFILLGLLLVFGIYKSLNNSATPVIDRDKIKNIEFKKAVPGVTRAYFIVQFTAEDGKIKQRLILLRGSLFGSQLETENAFRIMAEEFGK
jgi:hypothetical protein